MKYIAQPQFASNTIEIYSISASASTTFVTTLLPSSAIVALTGPVNPEDPNGPNGVLVYEDFSGSSPARYLLIAYTGSAGNGAIYVFDLDGLDLSGAKPTQTLSSSPVAVLPVADNPIGMAVRPGTGDLYVATDGYNDGNATVTVFPKISGGGWSSPGTAFSSYAQPSGFAFTAANLAFDLHGNLWMTSLGEYAGTAYAYLTCYTGVAASTPQNTPYLFFQNGAEPLTNVVALQGSTVAGLFPFSCPEGIAFDPAGNLWVASNNAESTVQDVNPGGSLLMISADWILNQLYPTLDSAAENGLAITTSSKDFVPYYMKAGAQPGGIFFDGWTMYVNDESHETVWQCDLDSTTFQPGSFVATSVPTTNPGNGTMAVFNYTPSELLIADGSWDSGVEPDVLSGSENAWESPDIGITSTPISPLPVNVSASSSAATQALSGQVDFSSLTGDTAYVYVRVTNHSTSSASNGGEILKVYWAKASTALDWPAPWDGSVFTSATPSEPLGGLIGASSLASIDAGNVTIVQFEWTDVPNPLSYTGDPDQAHFCLLARIEGNPLYPFGMTQPEQWSFDFNNALTYNVLQNRGIAWRNIKLTEAGATGDIKRLSWGILGANFGFVNQTIGFRLQTLGRAGKPEPIKAKVVVRAEGKALERLRESRFHEERLLYLGEGRFHLLDLERGLENIHLEPSETLPFTVEFTPEEEVRDFAIRVIQYLDRDGSQKVVGGQTFVVGEVEGFPVREKERFPEREE
jgi:hypothetical protein